MADVALEDLADRIRPYAPGCPIDTITQALVDVMRDFCNVTRAYIYENENESVQALVSDYDIELPNTMVEPVSIEYMTVSEVESTPKDPDWLKSNIGHNWRYREADDFRYYTQLRPRQFTFPCIPQTSKVGEVYYRVSLRPILTATTIDDEQSNEWLDTWSAGVLWKLKGIPEKQWSDAKGAGQKYLEYRSMRGEARIRASKAYGNVDQRWSNRRGFA